MLYASKAWLREGKMLSKRNGNRRSRRNGDRGGKEAEEGRRVSYNDKKG